MQRAHTTFTVVLAHTSFTPVARLKQSMTHVHAAQDVACVQLCVRRQCSLVALCLRVGNSFRGCAWSHDQCTCCSQMHGHFGASEAECTFFQGNQPSCWLLQPRCCVYAMHPCVRRAAARFGKKMYSALGVHAQRAWLFKSRLFVGRLESICGCRTSAARLNSRTSRIRI